MFHLLTGVMYTRPQAKPTVHEKADMKTVLTRGKASNRSVLIDDKSATADPIPSTVIIKKKSTENN